MQVLHQWRDGGQGNQDHSWRRYDQRELRPDFHSETSGNASKGTQRALLVRLPLSTLCGRVAADWRHDRKRTTFSLHGAPLSKAAGRSRRHDDAIYNVPFLQEEQQHPQGKPFVCCYVYTDTSSGDARDLYSAIMWWPCRQCWKNIRLC